jgi:hypothetical protein
MPGAQSVYQTRMRLHAWRKASAGIDVDQGCKIRGVDRVYRKEPAHSYRGGGFRSTVNADPESRRYHANLFKKLARVLRQQDSLGPNED